MLFREFGIEKGIVLEHADSSSILGRRVESGTSYAAILYGVPGRMGRSVISGK
jgi:hypothetical protein